MTEIEHRALMSAFPTGVAVITALDEEDRPHGLTCTSLASVTLSPPTLLVCLDTRSGTLGAIRHGGQFAVNLLHSRSQRVAEIFSTPVPDRFGQVRWHRSTRLGVPWLVEDAFALAACTVSGSVLVGDHEVVFGEVREIMVGDDVPLLYGMRRFATWLPDSLPGCTVS
ncbi:hypothetical protein TH66_02800 [Carbonactinospora thermoautotrophica]|uniref:Flavin reductase like domain-containing protein n=1 Tax=Carbonactinospora thermoautotrophica TaxID=1469144 RepID=A0A132N2J6_9ACTN|nr:hypothetical protein TR74_24360 [Carbonactinospora thermoautotrophica]KWX05364.1 hypothetical protein TH66_02800 [Carbonactinospora thermoautotrophica]